MKGMARPERFELPTFWFVAINTFVDLVQLTNHFGLKKGLNIVPKLDPKQGLVGRGFETAPLGLAGSERGKRNYAQQFTATHS